MMFITKKFKPNSILENACRKSPDQVGEGFVVRPRGSRQAERTPTSSGLSVFFILCVSLFFFQTSPLSAQIPSLQFSPTDILIPYLERALQDTNSPVIQTEDIKAGPTELLIPFLEQALSRLWSGDDIKTANFIVDVNQELHQIPSVVPAGINNPLGRRLWRAGIGFYENKEDKPGKSELKHLIEQIRAFEVQAPQPLSESVPINIIGTIEPKAAATEPNPAPIFDSEIGAGQSDVKSAEETAEKTFEFKPAYIPVTDQTLQMLANYAQDPNRVPISFIGNPLDLGEILYLSGHLKEAVPFYRQAINRIDKDQAGSEQNRAWILFQLGNCLREYDRPEAKKMYVQLITEYPQSAWADLAKIWEKLIDLYLKDDPEKLIKER